MQFNYIRPASAPENFPGVPFVPIMLYHGGYEIEWAAVVDSGATTSVLPYDLGVQLGLVWEEQTLPVDLGGVYRDTKAFSVLVRGEIAGFSAVALGFSWIDKTSDEARLLLGQMNFFQRFKVTFEAYKRTFDISLCPPFLKNPKDFMLHA
jgi:hypothetical protein